MQTSKLIEHRGYIKEIFTDCVQVGILSQAACGACAMKGACGTSEQKEKIIEVKIENPQFTIGEQVIVSITQSSGNKAVLIAYIIPVVCLLVVIIVVYKISLNELLSGILSLLFLSGYFLILYFLRNKLTNVFTFAVRRV